MALPVTLVTAPDCQQNWESARRQIDDLTAAVAAATAAAAAASAAAAAAAPSTGDIKGTTSASTPTGWLACDGASYLRSAQPTLFAAIGTTYGAADGTHFSVPNLLGRVPMGAGTATGAAGATAHALGTSGGEETHALITAELAVHTHGVTDPGHSHTAEGASAPAADQRGFVFTTPTALDSAVNSNTTGISIQNAGSGTAHNNLQPFQTFNWWIKA